MRVIELAALLAIAASPGLASALTPVAQARDVSVSIDVTTHTWTTGIPGFDPPDSSSTTGFADSASAPGFAPFDENASPQAFPSSLAMQDSTIGSSQIAATGSHAAVADVSSSFAPPPPFTQVVETHDLASSFSVSFTLSQPRGYSLSGSVVTVGALASTSSAHVRLLGPGASVVAEVEVASDPGCSDPACVQVGPEPLAASGTLVAGTYTLEADASGTASGFYSVASGDVAVPVSGAFEVSLVLAQDVPAVPPAVATLLAALILASGAVAANRFRRASRGPS